MKKLQKILSFVVKNSFIKFIQYSANTFLELILKIIESKSRKTYKIKLQKILDWPV